MDTLRQYIRRHVEIPEEELEQFCSLFKYKEVRKKELLLREGDICHFEGFVINGLFRVYHIDSEGSEHILYFAQEDWWITDIDSFTNCKPSMLYIEALEDSSILYISEKDKDYAYTHFAWTEKLFRIMTQRTHIALQRRMIENLSKNADQRYKDFMERYPALLQRLSNLQIAAYLGITHEFLSKIRRKIS